MAFTWAVRAWKAEELSYQQLLARVATGAAALTAGGVGEMVALVAEEAVPLVVSMLVEPRIVSFQVVLRLLEAFKWPKSGSDPLVRAAFRAAGPGALAAGALPGGAEDLRRQPGAGAPATARPAAVPGAGACRAVLRGPSSARLCSGAPFAGACGPLLCDLHLGVNRRKGVPARLKQLRGRPKCVLCEHQAALGYALGKAQVEELGVGKRQLLASHFTFDPAEGDVFGALCAGATLLAPRRPQVLSELQEVLHSMQASHATMTPSQWALKAPGELPHLKHLRLTSRASHGSGSIQLLKPLKFIET